MIDTGSTHFERVERVVDTSKDPSPTSAVLATPEVPASTVPFSQR